MLILHETAEEELVRPLSRGLESAGDAMLEDRLEEERQAKEPLHVTGFRRMRRQPSHVFASLAS
jgi:hypothetical protein